jgi:hypothetical protein
VNERASERARHTSCRAATNSLSSSSSDEYSAAGGAICICSNSILVGQFTSKLRLFAHYDIPVRCDLAPLPRPACTSVGERHPGHRCHCHHLSTSPPRRLRVSAQHSDLREEPQPAAQKYSQSVNFWDEKEKRLTLIVTKMPSGGAPARVRIRTSAAEVCQISSGARLRRERRLRSAFLVICKPKEIIPCRTCSSGRYISSHPVCACGSVGVNVGGCVR